MSQIREAALGLGSNLGTRRDNLATALDLLDREPDITITAASALYETEPWGIAEQPVFLNAAARIGTVLPPAQLLDRILAIEETIGRVREEKWGPRLIDIDILVFGNLVVDQPGLRIPHPRLAERVFALAPLADIWPAPVSAGHTAAEMLEEIGRSGIRQIAGPDWITKMSDTLSIP